MPTLTNPHTPTHPPLSPLHRIAIIAGIVAVLAVAAWLRFTGLADRPMHFDEATGAHIMAGQLESGAYIFNPEHFHGPLLSRVSSLIVRSRGENTWRDLTKGNLRLGVALFSLLTVVGALSMRRFGRPGDGLAAAAFIATCPLLAYYGRMFIHEPIFTAVGLCTLPAVLIFLQRPGRWSAAGLGVGIGLLAATRETFIIVLFAWAVAALAWPRPQPAATHWRERLRHVWNIYGRHLYIPALMAGLLIVVFYSDYGRNPRGVLDFIRTYFDYTLVPGHEKPFFYYADMLLRPRVRGGLWWTEIGVLVFALYGYVRSTPPAARATCRFLVHSGAVYLLVFSWLSYKTPWLPCMGWMHFCLAAGFGAAQLVREARGGWKIPALAAVLVVLTWQGVQSKRAVFRFAVDTRNPYAYVPTSRDAERMADWLHGLAVKFPELNREPVTVAGSAYWPLPWYLRSFDQVGYWEVLPEDAPTRPLILLVSSGEGPDTAALEKSHVFFPRGLRHEVLVTIAIRKDIWKSIDAKW